jgi:hypothetical protein
MLLEILVMISAWRESPVCELNWQSMLINDEDTFEPALTAIVQKNS